MENVQLCRLCARANSLLLPIFSGDGVKQKLSLKIHKYLPIQVAQDDCLPHHVCYSCSATLNAWDSLVEECIVSDTKFRDLAATQQKLTTVMADDEIAFQDTSVYNESEDENTVKQETDGSVGVTCRSTRYDHVSSVLSKFRIKKSLDHNTTQHEPVPENLTSSILLPPDPALDSVDCHVNNNNDQDNNHDRKSTFIEFSADVDCHEESADQSLCDDLPKNDNFKFFTLNVSKYSEQTHNQSVVASQSFKCDPCQSVLSSHLELAICSDNDVLGAHEWLRQKDIVHCQVCRKSVSSFRALKVHFNIHADAGLRLCNFCNTVFTDESKLNDHELTHQNEKPYLCETCGKAFRHKANMLNHCSTHLDDSVVRKFKCDICGTVYRSKNILKRHLNLHNNVGKKSYVCETCGKSFSMIQSLKVHVKVHSNSRPYKCTICEMAFKWKKNLRTHQHIHGTVTEKHFEDEHKRKIARVQCDICGKYLASKWNLSVHVKRHDVNFTGSSMCHICGKTLCDTQAMSRHLKVHAGIKPFKCAMCGKNFGTKMSRDDHERTHTGEKPFCCDVCGKCFSSKPHLHVHRVIHSDNRPFRCTYCPKSFRRRPHLVLHVRTHTGEKPYSCELCSRAFIQKNDMMKHMLTHSSERPFVCDCGISFRQKRDLNKHKRKHTGVEMSFPAAVTCS